jgi:prepilin-type N-terminal cleavage/methylation domain-containing protein
MANRVLKSRSQHGFTLIELLVVVIIIGILAAIALPNFIGAQNKAREASVKSNMRTVQIAAETYATDNAGNYPTGVNPAFESYFPGGQSDGQTAATGGPLNPFTGLAEWPNAGGVMPGTPAQMRTAAPAVGTQGQISYYWASPPTTYAIVGSNTLAKPLGGLTTGTFLVLSNQ